MNFPSGHLTEKINDSIFVNAAYPLFADDLRQTSSALGARLDAIGTDQYLHTYTFSAPKYIHESMRRHSVSNLLLNIALTQTYLLIFRRIQKFKILSSGLLGLVYSYLMQRRIISISALLEWYMHIQEKDLQTTTVRWVTLEKCAELVGWSKDAINALRVKGKIRVDVHWIKRNGRIFIDMAAFQQWIGTGK